MKNSTITENAQVVRSWLDMERSRYTKSDVFAVRVARYYSNERGGRPYFAVVGEHEGYDLASIDGEDRVEMKFETTPVRTGNAAIEFWNTELHKPSGILATMANRWLHIVPENDQIVGYELDVDVLHKLAIESGRVEKCGHNALCKIIPLAVIKQNAIRTIDLTQILASEVAR